MESVYAGPMLKRTRKTKVKENVCIENNSSTVPNCQLNKFQLVNRTVFSLKRSKRNKKNKGF